MKKSPYPNPQGNLTLDIVCIDLDGVLAEDVWPRPGIGKPLPRAEEMLKFYWHTSFAVTVFTARPWSHEAGIWAWLKKNKLDQYVYTVVCGKPLAAAYLDDKSYNPVYPPENIHWAAGFFDGEGCTSLTKKGNSKRPRMQISQKHREVLDKFTRIVGGGKVYDVSNPACPYQWSTTNSAEAERVFQLLRPHLGTLKVEQGDRVLAAVKQHQQLVEDAAEAHRNRPCLLCQKPAKARDWCWTHYKRWWKYGDPMKEAQ